MSAMTHFPVRIKELREANGLNQSQLATELGVSRGSISFYENSDRVPDAEFLYNAARYFHVSADWLLGLSDVKSPDGDLQQACSYTGLSEESIANLHTESKDPEVIAALDVVLSSDFADIHRINRYVFLAIKYFHAHLDSGHFGYPLSKFLPNGEAVKVFKALENWGGALLEPQKATEYYISQAAFHFQKLIETVVKRDLLERENNAQEE